MNEWIVFRKDKVWCDRLNYEWECMEIIQDGIDNGDSFEDYSHRIMTQEEINKYYK